MTCLCHRIDHEADPGVMNDPPQPPSVTVAPAGACDLGAGSDREQLTGLRAGWAWGAQGHAPGRPRDLGGVPSSLRWLRASPRFPSIKNARQEESTRQDSSRREGDEDPAGTRVPGPPSRSQPLVRAPSHLPAALPGSEPESRAVSRDGFGARRSAASAPSLSLSDRPLSSSRGAEPTEVTAWGAWPSPAPSSATTVAFISSGFDGARCPPSGRARPTGRPRRPDVPKPSPPLTLREGPPPPARRAPRQS